MEKSKQVFVNDLTGSTDSISQNNEKSQNSSESTSPIDIRDNIEENQSMVIGVTKIIKKVSTTKKRYDKINDELRMRLIDAVENKNEKIKHVAKRLGINYSSAKSICQVFKAEGRTGRKTCKKRGLKAALHCQSEQESFIPTTRFQAISEPALGSETTHSDDSTKAESQKDSLEILRDRLLESRNAKSQTASSQEIVKIIQNNTEYQKIENKSSFSPLQALAQNSIFIVQAGQTKNVQMLNDQVHNLNPYSSLLSGNGLPSHVSYNSQNMSQYSFSSQTILNNLIANNLVLNQPQTSFLNFEALSGRDNLKISQIKNSLMGQNFSQNSQFVNSLQSSHNTQSHPIFQVLSQTFQPQHKFGPLIQGNSNLLLPQSLINNINDGSKVLFFGGQPANEAKFYLA